MFKRVVATAAAMVASTIVQAQGTASVDLLEPAETSGTIPANTRIVDVSFDVAPTDVWTAAGIRAVAENGASIIYFDRDLNTPGTQPGLLNGGTANKFTTMLSKPRNRDAANRFTNAGAAIGGGWDPPGPEAVTLANELSVWHHAFPPETFGAPSIDGYIARIAVDVSDVAGAPADDALWAAGPLASVPASAIVVLRSVGVIHPGGTGTATYDFPAVAFSNWAMWYIPEPTTLALLTLGALATRRR